MFWFICALTVVVSAANLPCDDPDSDYRLPSKCPPDQVLHRNVCRSYFRIRSEGKACLLSDDLFQTHIVPTGEVICPLEEKPPNCSLYRAFTANCFQFEGSYLLPCKDFDVQREYESRKICAELTNGIAYTGFTYKIYPVVVAASIRGQCPTHYCLTKDGKCIREKLDYDVVKIDGPQKKIRITDNEGMTESNIGNLGEFFKNSMKASNESNM